MNDRISILFAIYYLGSGGAEHALINLLDMMDYECYDVDLLLFDQKGLYLTQLNKKVNLLPVIPEFARIRSVRGYCKWAVRKGKFYSVFKRLVYLWEERRGKNVTQKNWDLCWSHFLPPLSKEYDVAVGYMQGIPDWYVADRVKAKYKIGWVHNDYAQMTYDKEFDIRYFQKLDRIVSVSEQCTQSLMKAFPSLKDRMLTLLNLMSPKMIYERSMEIDYPFPSSNTGTNILTIGRLGRQKGYDMAIEACSILKKKGYQFVWYVIGIGELEAQLKENVRQLDIVDCFIFLGERSNPYPYIRQADIYVQPSYFEGKSIAIDEAKILCRPIVVTSFPSVYDQIEDGITGCVVDIDAKAIAAGIERMILDVNLRLRLSENLRKETYDLEEAELQKHYKLFEQML